MATKPSKKFQELIEFVESSDKYQHIMSNYFEDAAGPVSIWNGPSCGTAACIAGWAVAAAPEKIEVSLLEQSYTSALRLFTGLRVSEEAIEALMLGGDYPSTAKVISLRKFDELPEPRRKSAMIEVMKRFAETGKVEWTKVCPEIAYPESDNLL